MIGLTIGILLLTVLSALLVNNSQARVELDRTMQQVENGRYAMQLMSNELRLAGYYGEGLLTAVPVALPDPCATDTASLQGALTVAVQGYSQVAASPVSCLSSANVQTNSDILVVRRAQTESVALANLNPTLPYIQTLGEESVFALGANSSSFTLTKIDGTLAPIHSYTTQIYFISPCSTPASGATCNASADNGNPIPTLKRLELDNNAWRTVTLVEGIERMRVEYGVDNDADGAPDQYVVSPVSATDWSNVVAINIGLLARNTRPTPGHVDTKTYRLVTLDVAAPQDAFKRHAYSGVVRLMNVSGRREQ